MKRFRLLEAQGIKTIKRHFSWSHTKALPNQRSLEQLKPLCPPVSILKKFKKETSPANYHQKKVFLQNPQIRIKFQRSKVTFWRLKSKPLLVRKIKGAHRQNQREVLHQKTNQEHLQVQRKELELLKLGRLFMNQKNHSQMVTKMILFYPNQTT